MKKPVRLQLEYCTYCPKMCRHVCPVATASGHETFIPQAKMASLNYLRKGELPWDQETTQPLWACTDCRHCTEYCLFGVEPGTTLFAGRAEAVRRGLGHPALERYPERFLAREARIARRAREVLPPGRFASTARVGLFPGCDTLDKSPGDVVALLALLDRVGEDHVRLVDGERTCGGYPLLAAGHPEEFRRHAQLVAEALAQFETVIVGCAACVYALRRLYPAEGTHVPAKIVTPAEYLGPFIDRLPAVADRGPVYYHDPCYLARCEDAEGAPRQLLAHAAEIREFTWSRRDTECCGGAGLLPKTMPSIADEMARRRLREVAAAGGGTVVTSCGTCRHMLSRNAPPNVVVRDLAELVEERTR